MAEVEGAAAGAHGEPFQVVAPQGWGQPGGGQVGAHPAREPAQELVGGRGEICPAAFGDEGGGQADVEQEAGALHVRHAHSQGPGRGRRGDGFDRAPAEQAGVAHAKGHVVWFRGGRAKQSQETADADGQVWAVGAAGRDVHAGQEGEGVCGVVPKPGWEGLGQGGGDKPGKRLGPRLDAGVPSDEATIRDGRLVHSCHHVFQG